MLSGVLRGRLGARRGAYTHAVLRPATAQLQRLAQQRRAYATPVPNHLLNIPPTNVSKLQNGMRVATEESYGETATIGVFIDAGSSYEDENTNGVAHFLEHMAFKVANNTCSSSFVKGTANRTKIQLEKEIENMGGALNAYTSREQTVYYAKVFKQDVNKAIDILADILLNSTFDQKYLDAERSTILREAEEVAKDYHEVIFDYAHAAAYQGTSMGRTILGPEANIKKIQRDDLLNYIKRYYRGPRMVLAAAGAINHEQIVAHAEKAFASVSPEDIVPPVQKPTFTGSQITIQDEGLEDTHVLLGVEGVPASHPDYFTMVLIQTILGSWDRTIGGGKNLSSRLCETIATTGVAHSFTTFNTCYRNTGLFGLYATAPPEKVEDLLDHTLTEWNRLGKNATHAEVERAKQKLNATMLMQLDGTTAVCEDIGRQMLLHGRRLSPAEVFKRIDAITTADVQRVMSEHCEDVSPVVAAIGNIDTLPDYNIIQAWTYWNRM